MPDQIMALGNGAQFNSAGQAQNAQAVSDVFDLKNPTGIAGMPVTATYNSYVPPGGNTFLNSTPTSAVVTSSAPFQTQVDNTGTGISSLPPTVTPPAPNTTGSTGAPTLYSWTIDAPGSAPSHLTPDLNGVHTAGYNASTDQSVIAGSTTSAQYLADQQQRTALQQQRDQEIQNLTTQQGIDVAALNTTQANETGGDTRNLLAMGGYLGNNSFSNSYLSSLQVSHEQAMQTLNAKYTSAIQAAQNAYTNNDFAAADKARSDAAAYIKAAQDANTEFLNQTDKIQTQNRADAAQAFTEQQAVTAIQKSARDYATTNGITQPFYELGGQLFSTADGSMINSADQFTAAGGKPDYSNVFVVQPNTNKSYAGGDLGEFQYLVDQGKYQPGDLQKFMNQKKQDAVQIAAAGRGPSAAEIAAQGKALATQTYNDMDAKLQARVGAKDTFISPADWLYYRNMWGQAGNNVKDFDANYQKYANPNDDYVGLAVGLHK